MTHKLVNPLPNFFVHLITDLLEVELYPFGNTILLNSTDKNHTMECEHGKDECIANYVQACFFHNELYVLNLYDLATMPFANCMESAIDNKITVMNKTKDCIYKQVESPFWAGYFFNIIQICVEQKILDVST